MKKICEHEPTGEWSVHDGKSWATCKKCGEYETRLFKSDQPMPRLCIEDFKVVFVGDQGQRYFSHRFSNYEIALEYCVGGFDVAIYKDGSILEPKICTGGRFYALNFEKERREEDVFKAMIFANQLIERHIPAFTPGS